MDKNSRIESFLKSINEAKYMSNVVLVGGAVKNPDGTLTTKNNGSCTNVTFNGCNGSKNTGTCKNATSMCDNSQNGNGCENGYRPPSTNMSSDNCK